MDQVHVVITGAGAISPLGGSGEEILQALDEGRHGFVPLANTDPEKTGVYWGGELDFRPEDFFGGRNYRMVDRTGQLVLIAAGAALASGGLDAAALAQREVGLVAGTFYGSVATIAAFDRRGIEAGPKYVKPLDFANSVINAAAGQAAIWYDLRGVNSTVTGGGAAGIQAAAQGFDLIRGGRAEALLAGGAEELSLESLLAFARSGWLAPGATRAETFGTESGTESGGLILAEGAAFLLLEAGEAARRRGARHLGALLGHGAAFDPARFEGEASATEAIARAMQIALEDAGVGPEEIGLVAISANGLAWLDRREALAIRQVFGERGSDLRIISPKSGLGETLGAGGSLATLTALAALRRAASPDRRRAMVLGLGFDGAAAALVLEAAGPEETA